MKSKLLRSTIGLLVFAALIGVPIAAMALDCPVVSVKRIGVDSRFQGAPVQFNDDNGTCWGGGVRQFYLSSDLGNQGLATLLCGYSLGKTFWVRIAGDAIPGSLVTVIFLNN